MKRLCSPISCTRRYLSVSGYDRAVTYPKPDYGPVEVQRSKLLNGLQVAAAKPFGTLMASCTIMYQAGSRYEMDYQIGSNHFLRTFTSGSGACYSGFIKNRTLQQCGGSLAGTSDRQSLAYTLTCPVSVFPEIKGYLLDTAVRCCFHAWELSSRRKFVKQELERMYPEQRIMDLIQQAAFRGTLSNSIFCPEERVDEISDNDIRNFFQQNCRSDTCTVASVGLDFEEVMAIAEKIEPSTERPAARIVFPGCYRAGFEYYDLGAGSETWVAVAVPGTCSRDDAMMQMNILAASCGVGSVSRGQHAFDARPQAPLGQLAPDIYTSLRAFNISHDDAGIFGIVARTRACSAWSVARAAAQFLARLGDLTPEQIQVGKRRLKLNLMTHEESSKRACHGYALQLAHNVHCDSARHAAMHVDQCPVECIRSTAAALASRVAMMSYAVVGDIGLVPAQHELL